MSDYKKQKAGFFVTLHYDDHDQGMSVDPSHHPDLHVLTDPSTDTTTVSRFRDLLRFKPAESTHHLQVELARVFGSSVDHALSDADTDAETPSTSSSGVGVQNGSTMTVAHTLAGNYVEDAAYGNDAQQMRIPGVLDVVNNVCFAVFLSEIVALYGTAPHNQQQQPGAAKVLPDRMRNFWKSQWNDTSAVVEKSLDEGGTAASKALDDGFRLGDYLQEANAAVLGAHIPSTHMGVAFATDALKHAMFYLMQPWLVFRFVALFAQPTATVSFADKRSAELAIYRMLADAIILTRNSLRKDTEMIDGGVMVVSGDDTTATHERSLFHVFEEPGRHDVFVTKTPLVLDVLVVAGGGGGGQRDAGGGGGGGVVLQKNVSVPVGVHQVVVGKGGAGGKGAKTSASGRREAATDGGDSSFSWTTGEVGGFQRREIKAFGGGRGAAYGYGAGSGGGTGPGRGGSGGSGGDAATHYYGSGGAGSGDVHSGKPYKDGGQGGDGVAYDGTGTSVIYGGGGSTGDTPSRGGGGQGGGGGCSRGSDGVDNLGGGGGACRSPDACARAGDGGSGVVVLKPTSIPSWGLLLPKLEEFAIAVTGAVDELYLLPESRSMPDMQTRVAKLSHETKQQSQTLYQINAELQQRKANLTVMMHNGIHLAAAEKKNVVVFWVIVALYIALTCAVVALIALKYYNLVYLIAVVVILAILLWWLVDSLRGKSVPSSHANVTARSMQ